MLELLIYEALAVVSFFITFFAILFNPGDMIQLAIVGFIYFSATVIIKWISETYRWGVVLTLALFLPLFFLKFNLFYVVTPIAIVSFMFYLKENYVIDYKNLASISYGLLATISAGFVYVDSIFRGGLEKRIYDHAPLLLLYFLVSIIFLRTLRYKTSKIEGGYVRKSNLRFGLLAVVTYLLAMVESIRITFFEGIRNAGLWLFSVLFRPIYYVMGLFEKEDLSKLEEIGGPQAEVAGETGTSLFEALAESVSQDDQWIESFIAFMDTLQAILQWIAVVVIGAFILYKAIQAFRYGGKRYSNDAGVVMERTQIKTQQKKKKRKSLFFFGKSPIEEVRFLYHKHIHELNLNEVPNLNSEKVCDKGKKEDVCNPEVVRDIYRNIRYNNLATEQEAKQLLPKFKEAIK